MAIESCKIGSDRSETLLNLNEFSPAKQTQLAKLFRLSTPKNMIVPKDICRFWVSHIIDVQLLPSTLKEQRRRSSRMAIFQIAKGRISLQCAHVKDTHQRFLIYESVERYQRFLFQILKV